MHLPTHQFTHPTVHPFTQGSNIHMSLSFCPSMIHPSANPTIKSFIHISIHSFIDPTSPSSSSSSSSSASARRRLSPRLLAFQGRLLCHTSQALARKGSGSSTHSSAIMQAGKKGQPVCTRLKPLSRSVLDLKGKASQAMSSDTDALYHVQAKFWVAKRSCTYSRGSNKCLNSSVRPPCCYFSQLYHRGLLVSCVDRHTGFRDKAQ